MVAPLDRPGEKCRVGRDVDPIRSRHACQMAEWPEDTGEKGEKSLQSRDTYLLDAEGLQVDHDGSS